MQNGVDPAGQHVTQGVQHEAPQMGAGVWQDWVRLRLNQAGHVDDVQIQRAGRVRFAAAAPRTLFDRLQGREQGGGRQVGAGADDSVDIIGLA